MQAFIYGHYSWFVAAHVISMVAWMAGMFYLPRLFVYHAGATKGSELSETLKIMERRLLRAIINPSMIATFVFGICLLYANPALLQEGWIHVKLTCVLLMTGIHGMLSRHRKQFAADANMHSAKYYRYLNEAPTLLLIVIVVMVIVRPF